MTSSFLDQETSGGGLASPSQNTEEKISPSTCVTLVLVTKLFSGATKNIPFQDLLHFMYVTSI